MSPSRYITQNATLFLDSATVRFLLILSFFFSPFFPLFLPVLFLMSSLLHCILYLLHYSHYVLPPILSSPHVPFFHPPPPPSFAPSIPCFASLLHPSLSTFFPLFRPTPPSLFPPVLPPTFISSLSSSSSSFSSQSPPLELPAL